MRDTGAGVTATAAAAVTVTVTGMAMETPVPVKVMVPVYVPPAPNDAVFKVTDKPAGFDWLTLKLFAESPIHDWVAIAASGSAAVDAVLN